MCVCVCLCGVPKRKSRRHSRVFVESADLLSITLRLQQDQIARLVFLVFSRVKGVMMTMISMPTEVGRGRARPGEARRPRNKTRCVFFVFFVFVVSASRSRPPTPVMFMRPPVLTAVSSVVGIDRSIAVCSRCRRAPISFLPFSSYFTSSVLCAPISNYTFVS